MIVDVNFWTTYGPPLVKVILEGPLGEIDSKFEDTCLLIYT